MPGSGGQPCSAHPQRPPREGRARRAPRSGVLPGPGSAPGKTPTAVRAAATQRRQPFLRDSARPEDAGWHPLGSPVANSAALGGPTPGAAHRGCTPHSCPRTRSGAVRRISTQRVMRLAPCKGCRKGRVRSLRMLMALVAPILPRRISPHTPQGASRWILQSAGASASRHPCRARVRLGWRRSGLYLHR